MEERDNVSEFLKKMGMRDDQQPQANQWDRVIQPNSSYLIVGDVGTGKSALAYWLLETYSEKYNLLPMVVGLPRGKQTLLPSNFIVLDDPSECTKHENTIAFIDEADLQLPIEDTKAR
jgi:polynucleotide 5'-kinase involved in rRNA processing